MLDYKTVKSTTEDTPTLMQWLVRVEKALDKASLDKVQVIRLTENLIKLKFVFGDGSEIISEEIKTSGGGAGSVVETNDGTNGSNILGITIDGKRYSFQNYKTDAGDLLRLIQGSNTITIDLAEDGEHIEVHLDELFKKTLVTRSELNRPIDLPAGTNLLTYNWDAYTNGTWFKGANLQGMPEGTKGEFLVQLIKDRNTRFAIYLYNTDIYENNTGNYINYHYADKFEGWQKIQTNLNNDFVGKFVPIYDKDNPTISYGKENGLFLNDNIVSEKLSNQLKSFNFLIIEFKGRINLAMSQYSGGIMPISLTLPDYTKEGDLLAYFHYILYLEGNKLTFAKAFYNDTNPYTYHSLSSGDPIVKIYGGDLL